MASILVFTMNELQVRMNMGWTQLCVEESKQEKKTLFLFSFYREFSRNSTGF